MIGTLCGHSLLKHQVYDHSFCTSHPKLPEFFYHHHICCRLVQCCFFFVLAWKVCPEIGHGEGAMQCSCFVGQFLSWGAFGWWLESLVLDQDSCNLLLKWNCSWCLIKIPIFSHLLSVQFHCTLLRESLRLSIEVKSRPWFKRQKEKEGKATKTLLIQPCLLFCLLGVSCNRLGQHSCLRCKVQAKTFPSKCITFRIHMLSTCWQLSSFIFHNTLKMLCGGFFFNGLCPVSIILWLTFMLWFQCDAETFPPVTIKHQHLPWIIVRVTICWFPFIQSIVDFHINLDISAPVAYNWYC